MNKQSITHYWKATGVIPRWQLVMVYALVIAAGAIGFARTSHIANDADGTANRTALLAKENKRLSQEIQRQRRQSILDACKNQNERHKNALNTTLRLLAHPAVPEQRQLTARQERAQRLAIVAWVSALVPHQNCKKLVKEATSSP